MDDNMIVLPIHTRQCRPAHEYTIIFKLVAGDYYHVPVAQVQQICPELKTIVDQAVQSGTVTTNIFYVPRFLEQQWKDWWTVNDYIEQGCELATYEPISSFLTDACVYILATNHNLHAGAEAAVAATQDRAAEILDCLADTESTFDPRAAVFHLESLLAAARLACGQSVQQQQQKRQFLTTTEGSGGEVCVGGNSGTDSRGLRAMVVATCATLRPLLAELPALQVAVAEDAEFAALWERVNRSGAGSTCFTPVLRERMQWAIESCGS